MNCDAKKIQILLFSNGENDCHSVIGLFKFRIHNSKMFPLLNLPEDICHHLGSFFRVWELSQIKQVHPVTNKHYSMYDFQPTSYSCDTDKFEENSKDYRLFTQDCCWTNLKSISFWGTKEIQLPITFEQPMEVIITQYHLSMLRYFCDVQSVSVTTEGDMSLEREKVQYLLKVPKEVFSIPVKQICIIQPRFIARDVDLTEWMFCHILYQMKPNRNVEILETDMKGSAHLDFVIKAFPNLLEYRNHDLKCSRKDLQSEFIITAEFQYIFEMSLSKDLYDKACRRETILQSPAGHFTDLAKQFLEIQCEQCHRVSVCPEDHLVGYCLDCGFNSYLRDDDEEMQEEEEEEEEEDQDDEDFIAPEDSPSEDEEEEEDNICPDCGEPGLQESGVCIFCEERRDRRRRRRSNRIRNQL